MEGMVTNLSAGLVEDHPIARILGDASCIYFKFVCKSLATLAPLVTVLLNL